MTKLIPLNSIPYRGRQIEAEARRALGADALEAAHYCIEDAPGCYGGAFPAVCGWCVTEAGAEAYTSLVTRMPGGSSHRRLRYSVQ